MTSKPLGNNINTRFCMESPNNNLNHNRSVYVAKGALQHCYYGPSLLGQRHAARMGQFGHLFELKQVIADHEGANDRRVDTNRFV